MGVGVLCFNLGGHEQLVERVQIYRDAVKNARPIGRMVNDNIAALCMVHVADTDEEAYESAAREGEWFVGKAEELYAPWAGRNVPQSYQFAVNAVQEERVDKTADDHIASGAFAMGSPETVIKTIEKYREAGVDQILCFMQMGNLPHSKIMNSIRLFGKYVIPHFL